MTNLQEYEEALKSRKVIPLFGVCELCILPAAIICKACGRPLCNSHRKVSMYERTKRGIHICAHGIPFPITVAPTDLGHGDEHDKI